MRSLREEQSMRKVIDLQMKIWKTDIANIEVDLQFRDEILKPLMGLQYIQCTAPKYLQELRSRSYDHIIAL